MACKKRNKWYYINKNKKIKGKHLSEGDRVKITGGEYKGEIGVIMREEGSGIFKVGHASGHTYLTRTQLKYYPRG